MSEMIDRTPPHDDQAERAAIGKCLNLGRVPDDLSILKSTDFYEPTHAVIWSVMLWLLGQGRACDGVAVRARMVETKRHQHLDRLPGLLGEGHTADAANLAAIIADRAGRRYVIEQTTRTLQQAYDSEDPYEVILERAEVNLRKVPTRDDGNVDSLMTLDEFLGQTLPEPQWVMDGYLARGERLIITGIEGLGKTTWLRQMAICAAAGLDPFTGRRTVPRTVLAIDVENPEYIMQKRYGELRRAVNAHGATVASNRFWMDQRPQGLDLADAADRRWLQQRVAIVKPDLLAIGPAYKLHLSGNDDKDETIARLVTSVLDQVRTDANCALILEHHAGNEQGGGQRPVRPFGSSLWRRWPEFGYGIRPAKHPEAESRRIVDVIPWRGARDERRWPRQMESGGAGLPWVETVAELRLA